MSDIQDRSPRDFARFLERELAGCGVYGLDGHVIFGSTVMKLHGLKDRIGDVDLFVTAPDLRPAWRTRRAAVRGFWWALVRGYDGEICEACGRPVGSSTGFSWWTASDRLWQQVQGCYSGLLCIPCFTLDARRLGIDLHWSPIVHGRRRSAA